MDNAPSLLCRLLVSYRTQWVNWHLVGKSKYTHCPPSGFSWHVLRLVGIGALWPTVNCNHTGKNFTGPAWTTPPQTVKEPTHDAGGWDSWVESRIWMKILQGKASQFTGVKSKTRSPFLCLDKKLGSALCAEGYTKFLVCYYSPTLFWFTFLEWI